MEKLSLRNLEVQEMEKLEGGSCSAGWGLACGLSVGVSIFGGPIAALAYGPSAAAICYHAFTC